MMILFLWFFTLIVYNIYVYVYVYVYVNLSSYSFSEKSLCK